MFFMKQFFVVKFEYLDLLLFFCMGDFYELFYDDVCKVVCLFDIILIQCGSFGGVLILMVGVLVYVYEGYLVWLVVLGELVVICEQIGDLVLVKGLVECKVVCIVIFGIVIDEVLLDECCDILLMVLLCMKQGYGLVWVDLVGGCFLVNEVEIDDVLEVELVCLELVELLVFDEENWLEFLCQCIGVCCCVFWLFDVDSGCC